MVENDNKNRNSYVPFAGAKIWTAVELWTRALISVEAVHLSKQVWQNGEKIVKKNMATNEENNFFLMRENIFALGAEKCSKSIKHPEMQKKRKKLKKKKN